MKAVSVLVPVSQPGSGCSSQAMSQAMGQMLAQPSSLSAPSLTGQNLAQPNLNASVLSQALGGSTASMLSPSVVAASDATSTSSQLSNALTKLAIVQHQQQQQQAQQLQQQVAVNAALQAAASGATSSTLLPSIASNMSLGNLKSTSVASSVLTAPPLGGLEPIPSGAPNASGSSLTSSGASKVLTSDVPCIECLPASSCRTSPALRMFFAVHFHVQRCSHQRTVGATPLSAVVSDASFPS
jgi:hypothetical protein